MCPDYFGPDSVSRQPYFGTSLNNYCAASAPNLPLTSCVGYDPLNMNCSAFGSDIDLTSDYSYGGGYGFAGGGYAYNPDMMYQQMDKWTDYMYDRNAKYIEKGRANDARINTPLERAQNAADALREKVIQDEQSQIPQFFEAYKQSIKDLYPEYANLSDKELTARALEHYKQRNNNVSLKDEIRANSKNMFAQKYLHYMTLGHFGKGSAEESIEKITGNPMSRTDNIQSKVALGAAVLTGATAARYIVPNTGKILKSAAGNPVITIALALSAAAAWFMGDATGASKS